MKHQDIFHHNIIMLTIIFFFYYKALKLHTAVLTDDLLYLGDKPIAKKLVPQILYTAWAQQKPGKPGTTPDGFQQHVYVHTE